MARKIAKWIGIAAAVLVGIVILYLLYVILSYRRLEDHLELAREMPLSEAVPVAEIDLDEEDEFLIVTANLGFGAYDHEFDFFMDGGKQSWAKSAERVRENISGEAEAIAELSPDFLLFQEVDVDGTRSHHVNELDILREVYSDDVSVYAQNYDSAFLFWPLYQPHGKNRAGIVTMSSVNVADAVRRSLPISNTFSKFLDLDRCYSISRIPGRQHDLVLINLHLSAYGADPEILEAQRTMLFEDMKAEYEKGNYVIAGGDFNHDLIGNSGEQYGNQVTEAESWAQPFDFDSIPEGFTLGSKALLDAGTFDMKATCRDTGRTYDGTNDRWLLDGFIYSDNVEMLEYDTVDLDFAYSDHNPVKMKFRLKKD